MKIFITGATGFIGMQVAKILACRGESVNVLCRSTADVTELNGYKINIHWGDVLDVSSVEKAMSGCERVFHLAAYARNWAKDPSTFLRMNVLGLRNVLETAQKYSIQKVVFTSSEVTMGPSNGVPVDESRRRTVKCFTDYEHSKLLAEELVQQYVRQGLHVVTVNPTRVFGPGPLREGNSVTKMIQLYIAGKWRLVLGDGCGIGNYAFIDDVVQGHLRAMDVGKPGEKYILGGENVSYKEFFDLISDISGKRFKLIHVPSFLALAISHTEKFRAEWFNHYPLITPGWARTFLNDWACTTAKAERELGYSPTPLRESLKATIQWLLKLNGSKGRK